MPEFLSKLTPELLEVIALQASYLCIFGYLIEFRRFTPCWVGHGQNDTQGNSS